MKSLLSSEDEVQRLNTKLQLSISRTLMVLIKRFIYSFFVFITLLRFEPHNFTIHPLKLHYPMVFSILTGMCHPLHSRFENIFITPKKRLLYFSHHYSAHSTLPVLRRVVWTTGPHSLWDSFFN